MNIGAITLPDQSSQSTRINIGILFLLLESKLQHFTLEFYRALTASLRRKEATESQLAESLLNLIEAFSAEAELTARLADRISIDRMDAQHLVLDLSAVARVEEIHFEEVGLNGFWVRVQRTGSNQGLLFGKCGHGKKTNKGADICQVKNAHPSNEESGGGAGRRRTFLTRHGRSQAEEGTRRMWSVDWDRGSE